MSSASVEKATEVYEVRLFHLFLITAVTFENKTKKTWDALHHVNF